MPQTCLLIGAGSGVGAAVATQLAHHGHRFIATVSGPGKVAQCEIEHPNCEKVVALDLSDAQNVGQVLAPLIEELGTLDAVIVCAGMSSLKPAELVPLDDLRRTMEVNCVSNLAVYQAAIPALRRSRGRIIFTGSLSGCVATPMMAAYVASKFALEGLVDVLRQEAGEWGVEIVLLQPGAIDTPLLAKSQADLATTLAGLSSTPAELYGELCEQMLARMDAFLATSDIMSPSRVADVAMEALHTAAPQTRYRIGTDAEFLIEARHTRSDREFDALILGSYRSRSI